MSKKRIGFFIKEESLSKIEGLLKEANCKSRNEFVNDAIDFYIAYLNNQRDSKFLTLEIEETLRNVTSFQVDRILKNQAVEYNILNEILTILKDHL